MVKLFPSLPDNLAYTSGMYLTTVRMLSFDVHIITHACTCTCEYVHIHTNTHTYANNTHICTHMNTHIRIHKNTCTHTHTRTHMHTHAYTHTHTHAHTHSVTHAHAHIHTHTHTSIYTQTCTHAHTYTHIYVRVISYINDLRLAFFCSIEHLLWRCGRSQCYIHLSSIRCTKNKTGWTGRTKGIPYGIKI